MSAYADKHRVPAGGRLAERRTAANGFAGTHHMNFPIYYAHLYPLDRADFLGESNAFGHKWKSSCRTLQRVAAARRERFTLCLHNEVLFDQAMHFHFPNAYFYFQAMTHFPKFRHAEKEIHHSPDLVLTHCDTKGYVSKSELRRLLPLAMDLFVEQVTSVFRAHLPQLRPRQLFEALLFRDKGFGYSYRWSLQGEHEANLVKSLAQRSAHWATYTELRKAVERAGCSLSNLYSRPPSA